MSIKNNNNKFWVMDGPSTIFHAEADHGQWLCEGAEFSWETKLNSKEMLAHLGRALGYADNFGVKVNGSCHWEGVMGW